MDFILQHKDSHREKYESQQDNLLSRVWPWAGRQEKIKLYEQEQKIIETRKTFIGKKALDLKRRGSLWPTNGQSLEEFHIYVCRHYV